MSFLRKPDTFQASIRELESSWKSERYSHVLRPYQAEYIASKRGSLNIPLKAQATSKKLWETLNKNKEAQTSSLTMDVADSKQILSMAKNFDALYVSNLQAVVQPAIRQGERTLDKEDNAISNLVEQINQLQDWADRRQQEYLYESKGDREINETIDFHTPIVVDVDCYNGDIPKTMKLGRKLIEKGVSGLQVEDSEFGLYTLGNQKVLMPLSDHINRLIALRAQADIMNSDTVIMSRNACLDAYFVANLSDTRDHPFITGATMPCQPLSEAVKNAIQQGCPQEQIGMVLNSWYQQSQCMPYREAIANTIRSHQKNEDKVQTWLQETENQSLEKMTQLAKEKGYENVYWDCNSARSPEGYYSYLPSVDSLKARAKAVAPYCDVITLKTEFYIPDQQVLKEFSEFSNRELPRNHIGFNYPSLVDSNIMQNQMSDEILERANQLAKIGYVWQSMTLNPSQSAFMATDQGAQQKFQKELYGFSEQMRSKLKSTIKPSDDKHYQNYCGKLLTELNGTLYPQMRVYSQDHQNQHLGLQSSHNGQHNQHNGHKNHFGEWVKDKLGFGHQQKEEEHYYPFQNVAQTQVSSTYPQLGRVGKPPISMQNST